MALSYRIRARTIGRVKNLGLELGLGWGWPSHHHLLSTRFYAALVLFWEQDHELPCFMLHLQKAHSQEDVAGARRLPSHQKLCNGWPQRVCGSVRLTSTLCRWLQVEEATPAGEVDPPAEGWDLATPPVGDADQAGR